MVNIDGEAVALQAGGRADGAATDYFLPLDRPLRALECIRRGEPGISADLVGPSFRVHDDRLETSLYDEIYPWPYGPSTLLVDARTFRAVPLTGPDAARQALAELGLPDRSCPPGLEGVGQRVYR